MSSDERQWRREEGMVAPDLRADTSLSVENSDGVH